MFQMTSQEMTDAMEELDQIIDANDSEPVSRKEMALLASLVSRILEHLKHGH